MGVNYLNEAKMDYLLRHIFKVTIYLFMGCHIHKTPIAKGARQTVELFLNFYFDGHQQDVDWIKDALNSQYSMSGIEIVHFSGTETTSDMVVNLDTACIGSSMFVLFVSTNGSYPNLSNITIAEGDQKTGPDSLLYKFVNPLAISIFNFSITCIRTCVFEFSMVLASSAASVDVTFKTLHNDTLGVQLPASKDVYFEIHPISFSEPLFMTRIYNSSFVKIEEIMPNDHYFRFSPGLYMLFSRHEHIQRMLKYSIAISKIKVIPADGFSHVNEYIYKNLKIDVKMESKIWNETNQNYIFYPRLKGILKDEVEKTRFTFDKNGRSNATILLHSDTELEGTLDLIIHAVTANGTEGPIITYFPMKISIHAAQDFDINITDVSFHFSFEIHSDDISTLEFPTVIFESLSTTTFSNIHIFRCIIISFIVLFILSRIILV